MGPCDNAPRFHQAWLDRADSETFLVFATCCGAPKPAPGPEKEACTKGIKRMQSPIRSPRHESTIGILLAGGRATRMGGDKTLKTLRGVPLLARVIAILR